MSELVQIESAVDFGDGLAVLEAYHEAFLRDSARLGELLAAAGQAGAGERDRILSLARSCDQALHDHHRDEEEALFPLLVGRSFLIDGMMDRLSLDHEEIEQAWAELLELLVSPEWIDKIDRCRDLAKRFGHGIRTHIERENLDFFPLIAEALAAPARQALGEHMARLRRRVRGD